MFCSTHVIWEWKQINLMSSPSLLHSQLFSCIVSVTSLLTGVLLSVFLYAVVQSWQFLYVHTQSAWRGGERWGGGEDIEGMVRALVISTRSS